MKRGLLMVIALAVVLAACTVREENPNTGDETIKPETSGPTLQPAPETSADTAKKTQSAPSAEASFSEADLIFEINGKQIELNSDAGELLDELGDGYELEQAPSCLYEGMDKTFIYENRIEIYTYPVDGVDKIDEIIIFDENLPTAKGITVGSTMDDIEDAYGSGYTADEYTVKYVLSGNPEDLDSPQLYFDMSDGVVLSIHYYSASNII